jgi:hypothetical protein
MDQHRTAVALLALALATAIVVASARPHQPLDRAAGEPLQKP